ncbi:hypothetical protein P8452_37299 [Trifolium repens]|nr:hypothetical protein P8452_37299 [Trifolium repens]
MTIDDSCNRLESEVSNTFQVRLSFTLAFHHLRRPSLSHLQSCQTGFSLFIESNSYRCFKFWLEINWSG